MDIMQGFDRVSIDFARRKVRLLKRGESDGYSVVVNPLKP
jgi:hypothetical protein